MQPGNKAFRLSRLTREQVDAGELPVAVETTFLKKPKQTSKAKASTTRKRVRVAELDDDDDDENENENQDEDDAQSELSSLEEIAVPPEKARAPHDEAPAFGPPTNPSSDDDPIDVTSDDEGALSWLPSGNGWEETIPYGRN